VAGDPPFAGLITSIDAGRRRANREATPFDVAASVPVSFGDSVAACADRIRGYVALYVGGMGSREHNFYNALARRMGFDAEAERIQELFLARQHRAAMAAVPVDLIDSTSLLGSPGRITDRLKTFAEAGVTTLNVSLFDTELGQRVETLRRVSEALRAAGLAD
jgi:alkanesulfonate monooxygenase SsuD/methylene tetrahydromethanopterin reductase-like flavin-dependent oxidoreductase (luciferase family)